MSDLASSFGLPPAPVAAGSTVQTVYQDLRKRIITLELPPDTTLSRNELTETYSVTGGASTATGSANAVPSGRVRATIVPLNQSGSRR